jgi:hypothetical protein
VEPTLLPDFLDSFKDIVSIDFAGHVHTYERSIYPDGKGITYITSGGGGELYEEFPVNQKKNEYQRNAADLLHFAWVSVNRTNIRVHIIDIAGTVYDRFVIDR